MSECFNLLLQCCFVKSQWFLKVSRLGSLGTMIICIEFCCNLLDWHWDVSAWPGVMHGLELLWLKNNSLNSLATHTTRATAIISKTLFSFFCENLFYTLMTEAWVWQKGEDGLAASNKHECRAGWVHGLVVSHFPSLWSMFWTETANFQHEGAWILQRDLTKSKHWLPVYKCVFMPEQLASGNEFNAFVWRLFILCVSVCI